MKDKNYDKGRHRCHYRGKYRGAAHGIYNLKHSVLKKIPVAFPNRSKIKCKYKHNDEKCETCGIKYKYCNVFLNTQILKMIS